MASQPRPSPSLSSPSLPKLSREVENWLDKASLNAFKEEFVKMGVTMADLRGISQSDELIREFLEQIKAKGLYTSRFKTAMKILKKQPAPETEPVQMIASQQIRPRIEPLLHASNQSINTAAMIQSGMYPGTYQPYPLGTLPNAAFHGHPPPPRMAGPPGPSPFRMNQASSPPSTKFSQYRPSLLPQPPPRHTRPPSAPAIVHSQRPHRHVRPAAASSIQQRAPVNQPAAPMAAPLEEKFQDMSLNQPVRSSSSRDSPPSGPSPSFRQPAHSRSSSHHSDPPLRRPKQGMTPGQPSGGFNSLISHDLISKFIVIFRNECRRESDLSRHKREEEQRQGYYPTKGRNYRPNIRLSSVSIPSKRFQENYERLYRDECPSLTKLNFGPFFSLSNGCLDCIIEPEDICDRNSVPSPCDCPLVHLDHSVLHSLKKYRYFQPISFVSRLLSIFLIENFPFSGIPLRTLLDTVNQNESESVNGTMQRLLYLDETGNDPQKGFVIDLQNTFKINPSTKNISLKIRPEDFVQSLHNRVCFVVSHHRYWRDSECKKYHLNPFSFLRWTTRNQRESPKYPTVPHKAPFDYTNCVYARFPLVYSANRPIEHPNRGSRSDYRRDPPRDERSNGDRSNKKDFDSDNFWTDFCAKNEIKMIDMFSRQRRKFGTISFRYNQNPLEVKEPLPKADEARYLTEIGNRFMGTWLDYRLVSTHVKTDPMDEGEYLLKFNNLPWYLSLSDFQNWFWDEFKSINKYTYPYNSLHFQLKIHLRTPPPTRFRNYFLIYFRDNGHAKRFIQMARNARDRNELPREFSVGSIEMHDPSVLSAGSNQPHDIHTILDREIFMTDLKLIHPLRSQKYPGGGRGPRESRDFRDSQSVSSHQYRHGGSSDHRRYPLKDGKAEREKEDDWSEDVYGRQSGARNSDVDPRYPVFQAGPKWNEERPRSNGYKSAYHVRYGPNHRSSSSASAAAAGRRDYHRGPSQDHRNRDRKRDSRHHSHDRGDPRDSRESRDDRGGGGVRSRPRRSDPVPRIPPRSDHRGGTDHYSGPRAGGGGGGSGGSGGGSSQYKRVYPDRSSTNSRPYVRAYEHRSRPLGQGSGDVRNQPDPPRNQRNQRPQRLPKR